MYLSGVLCASGEGVRVLCDSCIDDEGDVCATGEGDWCGIILDGVND